MRRRAFTLVELLVVIAIVGLLIGLLLPAIQAAREAGRRMTCRNNLKQMGLASLNHVNTIGIYPTGGWGWNWVGDPNCGFTAGQPGGWTYNILPFIEFGYLHDFGSNGLSGSKEQMLGAKNMIKTPIPTFICPSRRPVQLYPKPSQGLMIAVNSAPDDANNDKASRCDYAMSCGSSATNEPGTYPNTGGPDSYVAARTWTWPQVNNPKSPDYQTGVSFIRSMITPQKVAPRGSAHMVLIGEKYLNPDHYFDGQDLSDNETLFEGQDNDIYRTTFQLPMQDTSGYTDATGFGSCHAGACNFAFADGSVHVVPYDVNLQIFQAWGTRDSGLPGDISVDR